MNNNQDSSTGIIVLILLLFGVFIFTPLNRITFSIYCLYFSDCPNPDMPRNVFRKSKPVPNYSNQPSIQYLPTPSQSFQGLAPPSGLPDLRPNANQRTRVRCRQEENMFGGGYNTVCEQF